MKYPTTTSLETIIYNQINKELMRYSTVLNSSTISRAFTKPRIASIKSRNMSSGVPSQTAQAQKSTDNSAPDFKELGIENTNIKTDSGVDLSGNQKVLVGSVLDVSQPKSTQSINSDNLDSFSQVDLH
jgi:hypothetical protein